MSSEIYDRLERKKKQRFSRTLRRKTFGGIVNFLSTSFFSKSCFSIKFYRLHRYRNIIFLHQRRQRKNGEVHFITSGNSRSQPRSEILFMNLCEVTFPRDFFYYAAIRVLGFNFKGYIAAIPARPNIGELVRYLLSRPFYYFISFSLSPAKD